MYIFIHRITSNIQALIKFDRFDLFVFDLNLTVVTPHNVTIIGFGIEFRVGFQMKEGARAAKYSEMAARRLVSIENLVRCLHMCFVD